MGCKVCGGEFELFGNVRWWELEASEFRRLETVCDFFIILRANSKRCLSLRWFFFVFFCQQSRRFALNGRNASYKSLEMKAVR